MIDLGVTFWLIDTDQPTRQIIILFFNLKKSIRRFCMTQAGYSPSSLAYSKLGVPLRW